MSIPFRRSLRDFRGFTLVELLVVIGIIAVLSTILLLQLGTARSKTRDVTRIAHINQLRGAIEQFLDDCGSYPRVVDFTTTAGIACNSAGALKKMSTFISPIPVDPFGTVGETYTGAVNRYNYAADNASYPAKRYQISAELELYNKSALENDSDIPVGEWTNAVGAIKPGGTEACTNAVDDCVFDLGVK